MMKSAPSVVASGVVSIIGSVVFLLLAAAIAFVVPPSGAGVPPMRTVSLVTAALIAALATLGIATGVGVLRLQPWARSSMLVFAGIMSAVSLLAAVTMAFIPLPSPPNVDASALNAMRPMMVGLYVGPLLIGVWWLIQFNTQRTKAAFASGAEAEVHGGRPLGVSILGWWFLVSGVTCVVPLALRMPVFLAGSIWTGPGATALYVLFGGLSCYLGAGLLRLDRRARVVTMAFLVLGCVNALVILLRPDASARMLEYQALVSGGGAATPMPDLSVLFNLMAVLSLAVTAGVIGYLVRRRAAFEPTTAHIAID